MAGVWDYNQLESINVATGRTEQTPTRKKGGVGDTGTVLGPDSGAPGAGGTGTGAGGIGGRVPIGGPGSSPPPATDPTLGVMMGGINNVVNSAGSGRDRNIGMVPLNPMRDLRRDLLEVPEKLTISVSRETVTFVDDLNRTLAFETNGKKRKYVLGAAQFEAKTFWQGPQLIKNITGDGFFKMTETYFLNTEGTRLFVVIRVGDPVKGRPPDGFNRVYDRVETTAGRH